MIYYMFAVMVQEVWFKAYGLVAVIQEPWFKGCGSEFEGYVGFIQHPTSATMNETLTEKVWIGVSTVDTFSANGSVDELEAEMLQGQKLQVELANITVIIVSWPLVIVIFTTAYIVVSGWLEMFPLFTTVHEICIGRNEDMDVSKGDGKFIHTTKKDVTSHDFTATHGSNIVIDGTAERGISVKRRELNYESMSEPELQVPFSSVSLPEDIGSFSGDVGKSACSLYVSSLGGCVPDVEAPIVAESLLQMDNVNVPVVSSSDHSMSQADVT
ncbi:hypothetical protein Tco_0383503, partial [Tanacetum coccineum]